MTKTAPSPNPEFQRRRRERIIAVVIAFAIVCFTALEVHLLWLSNKLPFVNSIFFFGLMNLNIILITLLLFLVFRNAVKLILDERSRKVGSRLKTRLVTSFILFAIIPTILLFTISALYIRSSFDKWFSVKVGETLQRSIEVVRHYYENTERSASQFARKVALGLENVPRTREAIEKKLQTARLEYGLDAIEFYADPFAPRILSADPERSKVIFPASLESLRRVFAGHSECKIQNVGEGELVRCGAFLGAGRGIVFANYFIPMSLSAQLSEISLTYEDFQSHNPLHYPIKSTYFSILIMMTLLILFSATWTGFYVAKRLTVPIEELLRGTEQVAQGNLEFELQAGGNDELAKLVHSFNKMTRDLRQNKRDIEATHAHLKKMYEALSHRGKYIEVLLESVQSGVISLDENGKISMINPAASELLQIPASELFGKPYWAIVPDSHRTEFREILLSVYGTAKPVRRELRIQTPKKQWVHLLVTLSALRDEIKKPMGIVAVFDDVTEMQKMERMIAWREVARRIAHEIKNPLTPIQLSVQRLRRRYLDNIHDDGTFGEATQIILNEVDSLKNLVSEFSSFARLPEIHQQPDDLNQIVLEAMNLFRTAHDKIQFQFELDEDIPLLELDRNQLRRALVNLFDNAVAAMQNQGCIRVTTKWEKKQGRMILEIVDEGTGIREEVSKHLFEPYFSTKQGGTGLGLAIVQRIVTDHGGFVRARANEPRGTKFIIELPDTLVSLVKKSDALNKLRVRVQV